MAGGAVEGTELAGETDGGTDGNSVGGGSVGACVGIADVGLDVLGLQGGAVTRTTAMHFVLAQPPTSAMGIADDRVHTSVALAYSTDAHQSCPSQSVLHTTFDWADLGQMVAVAKASPSYWQQPWNSVHSNPTISPCEPVESGCSIPVVVPTVQQVVEHRASTWAKSHSGCSCAQVESFRTFGPHGTSGVGVVEDVVDSSSVAPQQLAAQTTLTS